MYETSIATVFTASGVDAFELVAVFCRFLGVPFDFFEAGVTDVHQLLASSLSIAHLKSRALMFTHSLIS